jgi:hypothetical protein
MLEDWHLIAGGELDVVAQNVVQVHMMKPRKFTISLLFYVKGLPEINELGHAPDCHPFASDSELLGEGRRLGVLLPDRQE